MTSPSESTASSRTASGVGLATVVDSGPKAGTVLDVFYPAPALSPNADTSFEADLRVAAANVAQARALYRVQRAARLPLVDAGAGASVAREPGLGGGSDTTESYSIDVGVTAFELDLFGRLSKARDSASH